MVKILAVFVIKELCSSFHTEEVVKGKKRNSLAY